jgi:UrcA family protein
MTYLINPDRARRFDRQARLGLVAAALLAGLLPFAAIPEAAAAAEGGEAVTIAVAASDLADPAALADVRREIARAAGAVCDNGGLASIYRRGTWRCRRQVVADAERQLARHTGRLTVTDGR